MKRVVVDLQSNRPLWQVPATTVRAIRRAFGPGYRVINVRATTSSDGDGGGGSLQAVRAARGAEVYIGWGVPHAVAQAAGGTLRWAHSGSAGVGGTLTAEFLATGARLTNSRGVHAEPMADWILTAIGFCLRGFHDMVAAQRQRRWVKDAFTDRRVPVRELASARIGLVGLGGIGVAVARRCAALGMEVAAVRRRPRLGRPRGVTWVGGGGALARLARRSDVLVITAPLTARTRHLVDDRVLAQLPRGAFVVNVSRGALLDESALLRHIDRGRVAGAVLDVFAREPLPAGHVFWQHPRIVVSPHVSAVSDRFWDRETALITDNIRRYRTGRRLRNVVDTREGY